MQRYAEWAVLGKIRRKMEWVSEKNKNKIPYRTDENGDYDDRSDLSKEWRIDDGLKSGLTVPYVMWWSSIRRPGKWYAALGARAIRRVLPGPAARVGRYTVL